MLETHVAHDSVRGVDASVRIGMLPSIRVSEGDIVLYFTYVQHTRCEDIVLRKGLRKVEI